MLARMVQRWSFVDGGNLPGSMNAPTTPPSNRMVRPGPCSRCASVAASSGIPTPANTTCPSLSWRALRIASSSPAVYAALCVIDGRPRTRRVQDFLHPNQVEKFGPRFWPINETVEIFTHAADRILVHEIDVILHVPHHRFIDAVALVRRGTEWQFDHSIDGEKGNLGLIRRAANLVVRYDAFGRQDHLVGRHRKIDIHELQAADLRVAIRIASLDMNKRNVGIESGHQQKFFAGIRADHFLRFWPLANDPGAEHRPDRHEWHAHGTGAKTHAHRHMTPFVISRLSAFDVVTHHLGYAPENSLAEPARDNVVACSGAVQKIAVAGNNAARTRQFFAFGADKGPDQPHRSPRHR